MGRLTLLDRSLILVLLPCWVILFALHVNSALHDRLAEPGVFVAAPQAPDGFPVVRSLRFGAPPSESGLRSGDELLRIADLDLQGAGPIRFFALAMQAMDPHQRATVAYRRGEATGELTLQYTRLPLPIRFVLVSLSCMGTALLLIFRAPRNPAARACFRGLFLVSCGFLRPWGGPEIQTYIWIILGVLMSPFLGPACVYAFRAFRETSEANAVARLWPWLLLPAGPAYVMGVIGIPLLSESSNLADELAMALLLGVALGMLAEISISFRQASPVGRRQLKWIVYGLYVSLVPVSIATAISLTNPELWWLSDASEILEVLVPISVFIAIVRYRVYDIDRIISATASYSLLILVAVPVAFTAGPAMVDLASRSMGIGELPGRIVLSMGLASAAIPAHRYLNPRLDRWFFPERHRFEEGILGLLEELPRLGSPTELAMRASSRVDELLQPESFATYLRTADGYANVFARGRGVPPAFDDRHPVVAVLQTRGRPIAAERWSKQLRGQEISAFDRAALESLEAAVLVPVRRLDDLFGFAYLGPKRSGDIYTTTELALLGTIGSRVAAELQRFDSNELIQQGHQMREALRRYVPGAVADELETSRELRSAKREVSVLFVDIRGYSSFSADREAEEVFSLINRYTEVVSDVIRRHAGSIVEFNGDGMMAVFGAPHELASKERAAVEAARALPAAVAALAAGENEAGAHLSVGVGIATGEVFVGNIRAVDRLIWSAIGNTTNRAARLEALTREIDASIVIDEPTRAGAGPACADFVKRAGVPIRGYTEPLDLHVLSLSTA